MSRSAIVNLHLNNKPGGYYNTLTRRDAVSVILALCLFFGAFEYLFSINIGGAEVRVFQILLLFLSPLIFLLRRSVVCFIVANLVLVIGAIYSSVNGYFESSANMFRIFFHQEITIVTLCIFLAIDYTRINVLMILQFNFYAILIGSILGLCQFGLYNLFGLYINLSKYDMGDHLKWRVFGFFSEPNMYSLYYVLAVPLFYWYLDFRYKKRVLYKYFFLAIFFLTIFLSFSRGALLALIWFGYSKFVKKKSKWLNIVFLLAIVVFAIAFSILMSSSIDTNESLYRLTSFDILNDPSSSSRLDVFISLYNYYLSYGFGNLYTILFGNGLSSFRAIAYPFESEFNYFAMNLYIDILFEHGVIIFLLIFGTLFRLRRFSKKWGNEFIQSVSLVIPMFLIISLFYPVRTVFQYELPFILSVALLIFFRKAGESDFASLKEAFD